jgi:hypothetical protein
VHLCFLIGFLTSRRVKVSRNEELVDTTWDKQSSTSRIQATNSTAFSSGNIAVREKCRLGTLQPCGSPQETASPELHPAPNYPDDQEIGAMASLSPSRDCDLLSGTPKNTSLNVPKEESQPSFRPAPRTYQKRGIYIFRGDIYVRDYKIPRVSRRLSPLQSLQFQCRDGFDSVERLAPPRAMWRPS